MEDDKQLITGVDYYFLEEDCSRFKVSLPYNPYFYILCQDGTNQEVITFLTKKFSGFLLKAELVSKEDLELVFTLLPSKTHYLKKLVNIFGY